MIKKDDAFISHTMDDVYIERAIRAFTPWPRAWTTLIELQKLYQPEGSKMNIRQGKDPNMRIQLLEGRIDVNGQLKLETVQVDGKKPVSWKDFSNGYLSL
jgi:methionyl-tRNA formyltransferase